MPEYVLALDQGTTGTTVLIFNHAGEVCARSYSEFKQYYPKPGWVEHDAAEIWRVTLQVIHAALQHGGIQPGQIRSIGITNQRETVLLWERKSGKPVGRAIVWQDRRTADLCEELKKEGLEEAWHLSTGLLLDPYFSATKIHWLLREPEVRRRAEAGELACGTIDTWLLWNLSGGSCHATDYSNASRTMLYHITGLTWDDAILKRLDIPRAILPEVKPSSGFFATTAPHVFWGQEIPITGVAGDQQAALFGQGCHTPGMAKNTYGTGSFLLLNTGTKPIFSSERLLTTIAWGIEAEEVVYALEGSVFVTGAAIQWLRDGLGLIEDAAQTEALAAELDGNDDVYFVPALAGLGVPYWDPYARGMIIGLTRATTRQHLVRAALESIAYQACDVVEAMRRDAQIDLRQLRADGGAVANRFLMQFQADMLGVPVEVPPIAETTALGAAYLAGLGSGFWRSRTELAERWHCAWHYTPNMERAEARRLQQRWHQAVARSRGWSKGVA
ncbi:MAG: glycerol kinase GlpK [Desulfuromonadaceae bacterium]|nr:glycerol kinase GlpK [Desulfuromonas sp.]MDY0185056.1 glycerol kinase GlpK [Desulfuromonadaceae bacterium]